MKELFWRDFYYYLAYHDPSILGNPLIYVLTEKYSDERKE